MTKPGFIAICLAIGAFVTGCSSDKCCQSSSCAAPTTGAPFAWTTATPESQGMSSQRLKEMSDALAARRTAGLLVIRNDKIVYEWYAPGKDMTSPMGTASMAKAVVGGVSTAVALSDGLIALDDKASKYIPQWKDDPRKSRITVRELGSHTSGLADASVWDDVKSSMIPHEKLTGWEGDFWKQLNPPRDPFTLARDFTPVIHDPAEKFEYSNPGIAMLMYCVTASLRDAPIKDCRTLLRDRVMRPIGAKDSEWSVGYKKTPVVDGLPLVAAWGGADFTARALARLGRLMLREGNWEGKQLISKEAVHLVTTDAGTVGMVGVGWWSNNKDKWPDMPKDAFWGAGAGHKTMLVVPSLKLIAVRFGENIDYVPPALVRGPENARPTHQWLFKPLMEAITDKNPVTGEKTHELSGH